MKINKFDKCIIDKKSELEFIYNFGNMTPTGIFKKNQVDKINLTLKFCKKYNFGQISQSLMPEIMFDDYHYRSSTTLTMKNHFQALIKLIEKKINIHEKSNILDIGCNDGTLLNMLDKSFLNSKCYGIDPSKAIKDAKTKFKKYKFINEFFPSKKLTNNKNLHESFKLITCTSVFYDFPEPIKALGKIKNLLSPDGIFLCEVNYFLDLIRKSNFDMIGHEHLSFYSLKAFLHCCKSAGLNIIDVKLNKLNGGNIVFICSKNPKHKISSSVKKILKTENDFFKTNWKKKFIDKIKLAKKKIFNHLKYLKKNKKKVAIYGASTRGDTVLQLFPKIEDYVEFAIDKMKIKHGLNMPGTNIKIYYEKKIPYKVDSYFVLPYYFMREFIKKERTFIKRGGEMFTFKPNFRVINKKTIKNI